MKDSALYVCRINRIAGRKGLPCLKLSCVGLEGMYRIRDIAPCILHLRTRWSECSVSPSGSFTLGERASVAHRIGGRVGSTSGLDVLDKRKSLASVGKKTAAPWSSGLMSIDYTDCAVFIYSVVIDWFVPWWNWRHVVTDTGKWRLNLCSRAACYLRHSVILRAEWHLDWEYVVLIFTRAKPVENS